MEQKKGFKKMEEGVIPIGKQAVEFYSGVVYKELYKRNELKLVSRGDFGIGKVLSILTDLLSAKVIELSNNQVVIDFKPAINDIKQEVMLPNIEVTIKKI